MIHGTNSHNVLTLKAFQAIIANITTYETSASCLALCKPNNKIAPLSSDVWRTEQDMTSLESHLEDSGQKDKSKKINGESNHAKEEIKTESATNLNKKQRNKDSEKRKSKSNKKNEQDKKKNNGRNLWYIKFNLPIRITDLRVH